MEPLMNVIREVLGRDMSSIQCSTKPIDWAEYNRQTVEFHNRQTGSLTDYDCTKCLNRGQFDRLTKDGYIVSVPCECMEIRKSMRLIRKSGMAEALDRYTLENWTIEDQWQGVAADAIKRYADEKNGWFVMAGDVGAGKTHLCTALCGMLLKQMVPVRYTLWREFAVKAKSVINDDEEYERTVGPLKRVKCLYIDDFLKTGKGAEPTTGDINLAFELINARYIDRNLLTIISTERSIDEIMSYDEALGSRIYERSKGWYIPLNGKKNWRLRT